MGRADLAGAARLELVSGVAQLRPEDAMFEAMLPGWRAQQAARGLKDDTIGPRERLMRRFGEFTGEYPWAWSPGHLDEWSLRLTAEQHLAPSTIRSYQCGLRLFTEFLIDGRYGWAVACEQAFGPGKHPVAICHEWNTIAHLNDYEGSPEARPFTREEMQRFLDYADGQVERAARAGRKARWRRTGTRPCSRSCMGGAAADRDVQAGSGGLGPQPGGCGVRPVRHAERPLRQGQEGPAAAPP
jgi:integrase/recombinase XerC